MVGFSSAKRPTGPRVARTVGSAGEGGLSLLGWLGPGRWADVASARPSMGDSKHGPVPLPSHMLRGACSR
eukprot:1808734-Alexandrium_andersonii.AAC.1